MKASLFWKHMKKAALFGSLFCLLCPLFSQTAAAAETYYSGSASGEVSGPGKYLLDTRTDNFDEAPQFHGGEIRFLANKASAKQQLCGVFKSSDGKVLVVDGGVAEDSSHLLDTIKEAGGVVDAWLITHPQDDHIGALYEILHNRREEIEIRGIYYNFHPFMWYVEEAPSEQGMVWQILEEFASLPQEILHGPNEQAVRGGTVISLSDRLSFRVINDPLKTSGIYAVNNSSLMYDITMDGKHIIVLGDMGPDGGEEILRQGLVSGITADYVVMSHHGQNGVTNEFYQALKPSACIWSCPDWLFNASENNTYGFYTYETKQWVRNMGIKKNYATMTGDIVLR